MSFLTTLQQNLGLSAPSPSQVANRADNDLNKKTVDAVTALQFNDMYLPREANWYTAKPYGFRMNLRDGRQFTMFLPINPSNLNITTSFATNVIPTLYGTVEEHSDIRYYDIVIEGTTGMAPKFVSPINTSSNKDDVAYQSLQQPGRAIYPINSNVALGGFFSNTIGQITNILNQANKALSTITGDKPKIETGLYTDQTGYIAFHNLYRFLKKYKENASGVKDSTQSTRHPLTFFNYKDGNEYDVAIRSFVLRKSADNPMLYFYSIVMRGYNIRESGANQPQEDIKARLAELGLDGVKSSSLLSSIKSVSSNVKAIVGSAVNGINLFGR